MKLLLDNNLSPKLVSLLAEAGHDVRHVRNHGLAGADDPTVLAFAADTGRVLISADTDFGTLLASAHAAAPSFVLVRRASGRRVSDLAALIVDNLPAVREDLETGAVVVLGESSIRIRRLPIH